MSLRSHFPTSIYIYDTPLTGLAVAGDNESEILKLVKTLPKE